MSRCAVLREGKDAITPQRFDLSFRAVHPCAQKPRSTPLDTARRWGVACVILLLSLLINATTVLGETGELILPVADQRDAITVVGQHVQQWRQGQYDMWLLEGGCEIKQGDTVARCNEAVLWVRRVNDASSEASKIIAYLENDVRIDFGSNHEPHRATGESAQTLRDRTWFGRFHTVDEIRLHALHTEPGAPPKSPLLARAQQAWKNEFTVQPAQYTVPPPPLTPPNPQFNQPLNPPGPVGAPANTLPNPNFVPPAVPSLPATSSPPFMAPPPTTPPYAAAPNAEVVADPVGGRPMARFTKIESRNSVGFNAKSFPGGITIDTGVRLVAEGIQNVGVGGYNVTRFDIEADRVVIWADPMDLRTAGGGQGNEPNTGRPIEVYLEGNIVFREGERVIYADRMYYNITNHYGVVLNAEMLTPVPESQGIARLKADVLQQLDQQRFQAFGTAITTSRLGVPRYWLQSENVQFESVERPLVDRYTGQPILDPVTGQQITEQQTTAKSHNNWVFLAGLPVLYWPTIATDLKEPNYYVTSLSVNSDKVFGSQVRANFDAYQLFGIQGKPDGTDWTLSIDYLSKRGVGGGTNFEYHRDSLFGFVGPVNGDLDAWFIQDSGIDNLGSDRRAVPLEKTFRGRVLWQHRQYFADGYQFTGELGYITDRNFLEQYFEREWDQQKDQTTGLELKHYSGNSSWSITADARVNAFFTQTNWLPRFDHYLVGESLLFDYLTWYGHSSVGYAKMQVASTPTNPVDLAKFQLLAWEADREGLRAATRQELDLPMDLGPVKVVPYVLGELAHWGEDLSGQEMTRAFGQAGIRASLPMWRANPEFQSELFNINGLAHKITWESEVFFASANQNMNELPLYDQIDDDSIEHFRRRFYFNTFNGVPGGNIPLKFDERYYALRSGLQSWVTSPSTEIADDLAVGRLSMKNRWQTKRGLPGQQRIVDLIQFDISASFFPNAKRDNFDEQAGLIDYDFRWFLGDRLSILSDGYADVFSSGLRTASIGGMITRPEYGSAYVGFRTIDGPMTSNVLTALVNYRASEKWIITAGSSYDFSPTGNIGQLLNLTRVGESFLIKVGFNWDVSRGNVGANFGIEPRFLPNNRLGRVGGVSIPTAGVMGLE